MGSSWPPVPNRRLDRRRRLGLFSGFSPPWDCLPAERGLPRLRGKDSNLDYLIQSQASYH
jgi:hypothetical protein